MPASTALRARSWLTVGWMVAVGVACGRTGETTSTTGQTLPPLPGERTGTLTTARPSVAAAVREHFGIRPSAVQPVEFPHDVHVASGIGCGSVCHPGAATGPVAGLPSVKTCMTCHVSIAKDQPRIQEINRLAGAGVDLSWQRVFSYVPQAHVRFSHAPHIRAKVDCTTCHGPIGRQTVARRNVNLTMGFCVRCHRANKAPDDCLTCHL